MDPRRVEHVSCEWRGPPGAKPLPGVCVERQETIPMHRRSRLAMFAALLAVPGFATACGGGDDDDATDGTADGDAGIGCREDPRAETFVANMEHAGTGGLLTFV